MHAFPEVPSRSACLAPVFNADARLLILGSLPGRASLLHQQYYAHPRNQFWQLVGGALGVDLETPDYEARLALLKANGVALWDCIAEADREGSLDSAIRNVRPNTLKDFTASLPRLETVASNGATSAALAVKLLKVQKRFRIVRLPSSSPTYTLPFEQKLEAWKCAFAPGSTCNPAPPIAPE